MKYLECLICFKIFLLTFCSFNLNAQYKESDLPLIPRPLEMQKTQGIFLLDNQVGLDLKSKDADIKTVSTYLIDLLKNDYGIQIKQTGAARSIRFELDPQIGNEEGYILHVSPQLISIKSKSPAGAFMAVQTLRQLIPIGQKGKFEIPSVVIRDEPRFAHRGVMLDVGRYYFPVSFIKKYIDVLAAYKINKFHLHLTEDGGWRMEIKKYPKLQEVSAWRDSTVIGHVSDKPRKFDGKRHGGYYTHEELKDLVKYAQDRFITIIPEIDMPGHTLSALAGYPELSCFPDRKYRVLTAWGIQKDILCPKESTFKFVEDVLTEVMEVFPSKYIHIGGDEAKKDNWKVCSHCQELIRREGLKDEHGLQSYFIKRVEKFVNSKGRAIIGWDEILEGGLAPNATVMSWRGEKGGIDAAKLGHDVIMSPNHYMYLDYYQTPEMRKREPVAIGSYLPLETVYSYNPLPKSLTKAEKKHILGVQAHVWSEYIPNGKHAEHMTFPRVLAMAEVGWTAQERKDYSDFISRLKKAAKFLDTKQVNYSKYFLEQY